MIETLPDELQIHILSYVPLRDLCQVALLSKGWYHVANDDVLWRKLKARFKTTDETLYQIISNHPKISHFDHNSSMVTEAGLRHLCVQCWQSLTHLQLRACDEITPDLIGLIAELCIGLTLLDLSTNVDVDDSTMCQLSYCQRLSVLRIRSCDSVTDAGLSVLLAKVPLKELDASYVLDVRITTIENLVKFSSSTMQCLYLDGGNLTDDAVSKIGRLSLLQRLELQYCDELTDEGITPLSSLRNITHLKLFRCFNMTSNCVTALACRLQFLSVLVLSDCTEVDDGGLISIAQHCHALTRLDFSQAYDHSVTDVGMGAILIGCANLERLVLKGMKGVRRFVSIIPVLQKCRLRCLKLGGCQHVKNSLLESVAAFCPQIEIFGSYANEIKPSKYITQTLGRT